MPPDPVAPPAPQPAAPARKPPSTGLVVGLALVTIVAAVVAIGALALASRESATEFRYTIPAGTGARIDDGEAVEIVPADLSVLLGDAIVIDNQDDRNHVVGPFAVRPGEVFRHQFASRGVFQGECTVHSSKQVTITVT